MPFFTINEMIMMNSEKKEIPNRAEVLDGIRDRKKRFGWV